MIVAVADVFMSEQLGEVDAVISDVAAAEFVHVSGGLFGVFAAAGIPHFPRRPRLDHLVRVMVVAQHLTSHGPTVLLDAGQVTGS